MIVKEFIEILKKLPQDFTITYEMSYYKQKENKHDLDLYDLFYHCGTKNIKKENQITLWCEE